MKPKYYFVYLIFLLGFLSSKGQIIEDSISGRLTTILELILEKNPQIQRQELQVKQAQANWQNARSTFDYHLTAFGEYYRDKNHLFNQDTRYESVNGLILANNYIYSAGLQRAFRSGLSSSVSLNHSRISNNYPLGDFGEQQGAFVGNNYTSLRIALNQPLLKGRGRKYATANEQINHQLIGSRKMDLVALSASEVENMVQAYWNYLGSYQRFQVYQENENRISRVLEMTRELVEADRKTKNDLIQIQADLADKERQTLAASQDLYQARQNLGRSIGLNKLESTKIGVPLDPFPSVGTANYSEFIDPEVFCELASKNRAELQALIVEKDALEVDYELSKNHLKPQLDLQTFASYGGTDVGNGLGQVVSPLGQIQGRNVQAGIGLNFQFPLNNNAAEAKFLRSQVALSDQKVLIDNQIRNIELNISIALNELHNRVKQLEKAQQTLTFYQEVFEDEQIKFRNGLTTLLNLILFQERLTFAQLDYIQAQQNFANTVIALRKETGTLVPLEGTSALEMNRRVFYELPE